MIYNNTTRRTKSWQKGWRLQLLEFELFTTFQPDIEIRVGRLAKNLRNSGEIKYFSTGGKLNAKAQNGAGSLEIFKFESKQEGADC
jgi:hypothetical protein